MTAKIRRGDRVVVLTGKDKGKTGEVIRVFPKRDRALVSGVNVAKRHLKQSPGEQGGIVSREMPVHISNLANADPKDGRPTRVTFKVLEDGRKVRVARRSWETIDG